MASQDATRHQNDLQHHSERAKDVRLDRKDATGRGHETEKKGGAGKANWGTLNDEVEAQLGSGVAAQGEEEEPSTGPEAVSPRDFVANDDVLTLDEYEKRKQGVPKAQA
ncbi:hypothetical protein D9Q98_008941 [Chlorella vulgaris]|uniref:Hyaluronan/mRNA-binding protein domain-containing protein n=1 Tax=Chlorella vulgaris TaxID=3077 RepID=A0A9D4YTN6_CHLVU|nr:hypothetical protein D9Q98_008941 [Chlorella vulgaris]